ncbi:hypothetical protein [Rhodopirellula islandica]|nr:hypothetical protein [Rhodopirellula islandica]
MTTKTFTQRLLDSPLATVADYYTRHLNDNAHPFLSKNCLSADDSLRVGFADRTLGKQIPAKQLKLGRDIRARLKQVGILKASGHESLRGFVTVPLTDREGNTTGIYGLRIDNKGKDQPQLTFGNGIFNATALTPFNEIILCDSLLDAWTFHAAGHANAIAAEGQQLNKEYLANVKYILLADVSLDESSFDGIELMRIHFPEETTVNQYAIQNRTVDDALGKRIRAASVIECGAGLQPVNKPTTKDEQLMKETPTASPTPAPIDDIQVEHSKANGEITLRIETRRCRVRGVERNTTTGVMKINLMIFNERNERVHVDKGKIADFQKGLKKRLRDGTEKLRDEENAMKRYYERQASLAAFAFLGNSKGFQEAQDAIANSVFDELEVLSKQRSDGALACTENWLGDGWLGWTVDFFNPASDAASLAQLEYMLHVIGGGNPYGETPSQENARQHHEITGTPLISLGAGPKF